MSDRVWRVAEAAAVIAAVGLFLFRPEWSEDQPLPPGSPAALSQDSVLQWVMDTKLEAPDWPIQIAAASLVIMPTKTSNCSEVPVETSPTGGKSVAKATPSRADERFIVVASTTSTQDSGLFDYLLPIFTKKTGIEVRVVAKGTGRAIKEAENGDADVLFVHDKKSEETFVADGFGVKRFDVMYNDFILVGPKADPAGIAGTADVTEALKKIAAAQAPFASRGDDSGTHKAELRLWQGAAIDVKAASGSWYRETGSGMGPTLNTAAGMGAYVLTDRGTWLSFKNKGDLTIRVEGDKRLFNQYGVMLVNPQKHPHVKAKDGQAFVDWLISPEGQQAIAGYKIDGQQLFFPNHVPAS